MSGQSNAAAERSAHVERSPAKKPGADFLAEVRPGTFQLKALADAAAEIEWLRGERDRLAADLAKAHKDALAWMQKANQQAGKVSVTRELVESVLEDAEASVTGHYFADGKVIAALESRYRRDMADILALRAELQEASNA